MQATGLIMYKVQVVLYGLLLSISVLNGVESACNYFQNMEPGQEYYVYSLNSNKNESNNHCTWETSSPYNVKISCSIEINKSYNCDQERLLIQFINGTLLNYCGTGTFVSEGPNPTIKFDSKRNPQGQFLCKIQSFNTNCTCGRKKVTRIVGGTETGINEFPMMGGVVDLDKKRLYCGCTIISQQYVITAAHCIERRNTNRLGILVGEHNISTGYETTATKLIRVAGCRIHPLYNELRNAYYDVAICKVSEPIIFSPEVGPVCLPFQHKQDSLAGNITTALGWGSTYFGGKTSDVLQKVDLNVISISTCLIYYPDVSDYNICTYTPNKDTCQMDSGGPLLWEDPITNKLMLAGITVAGIGCASENPGVSMRTGAFIDWIRSETPDVQYCQIE